MPRYRTTQKILLVTRWRLVRGLARLLVSQPTLGFEPLWAVEGLCLVFARLGH